MHIATRRTRLEAREAGFLVLNTSNMYFHFALINALIMSYVCNALSSDLKFVIRHVK